MNKNIKVFKNFKTRSPGVWHFTPNDVEAYKHKKPCHGFGTIKYPEGSIYTGDIYFDGTNYNKIGFGQQEFTDSVLGAVEPAINEKKFMYVGSYDYRKTDWIYGNGVLYYKDLNGNPSRFIKGFFVGLDVFKPYTKEFDYNTLIDGYTKEMESDYNPRKELFYAEKSNYKDIEELDTLFVGDSYFEFWYYEKFAGVGQTFKETFDKTKYLNVGLGGSKFIDWFEYIPLLSDLKEPKNIVINLGFNDLHSNFSVRKVYKHFLKFIKMFKEIFPNSNYYLLNVVGSPNFPSYYGVEKELNELMEKRAKINGIKIIHNSESVHEAHEKENCFDEDAVHLNPRGYEVMLKEILKNI